MDIFKKINYINPIMLGKKKKKKPPNRKRNPPPSGDGNNQYTAVNKAGLNINQQRFAEAYLAHGNGTLAYREAYPDVSYGVAAAEANRMLKYPKVREYINRQQEKTAKEAGLDRVEVMNYWAKVMRGMSQTETLITVSAGAGLSSVERAVRTPTERERLKASEFAARHLGMFADTASGAGGAGAGIALNIAGDESQRAAIEELKARKAASDAESKELELEGL